MVTLHTFFALAAGLAAIVLLTIGMARLLALLVPGWADTSAAPQPAYVFVNIGYSFLAAAAGGYITALAAQANPLVHVLALAIIVLALSALSALQSRGKQPAWYALALVAISPLGVLAGGLLRLRVLGIL